MQKAFVAQVLITGQKTGIRQSRTAKLIDVIALRTLKHGYENLTVFLLCLNNKQKLQQIQKAFVAQVLLIGQKITDIRKSEAQNLLSKWHLEHFKINAKINCRVLIL